MPDTKPSAADTAAHRSSTNPELTITRTFNAPRALVYELFTEPEHLMKWMGPYGFNPMNFTQDARVGGSWRGMLRPTGGGNDLWQGGTFREISPPSRVSYTFAWDDDDTGNPGNVMLVTIDFEDLGDKTRLHFHQSGFTSAGQRDGHDGGWSSSFDRFEGYLATVTRERSK